MVLTAANRDNPRRLMGDAGNRSIMSTGVSRRAKRLLRQHERTEARKALPELDV
jgi:hypothetical protein